MAGPITVKSAQQEVVLDAHFGKQLALLGDQGHSLTYQFLDAARSVLPLAEVYDLAARRQQTDQRTEQCGLAGAVRADDGDDLAAVHLEGHPVQRVDLAVADRQVTHLENDGSFDFAVQFAHSTPPR